MTFVQAHDRSRGQTQCGVNVTCQILLTIKYLKFISTYFSDIKHNFIDGWSLIN